jgi:SAM-dependent methyltransferase
VTSLIGCESVTSGLSASILCPKHIALLAADPSGVRFVCPAGCSFLSPVPGVINLLPAHEPPNETSDHYSLQWGAEVDFASFYRSHPQALSVMTSKQMGWPGLVERVRSKAREGRVQVFDAACGYGGLLMDLFARPVPDGLQYIGADIHEALPFIERPEDIGPERALLLRWDISDPLPTNDLFDVIVCRAAIHHTPEPRDTFRCLVDRLAPGGLIAITLYARKGPMREASDDALRGRIVPMAARDAFDLARQFTLLGADLQASQGSIEIAQDLPFLGIRAGRYGVHEFIYHHLVKCWFNSDFGERYSDVVNFDWYHPPYAYRYEASEIAAWFAEHGLEIVATNSTKAQHYFEGRRSA